MHHILSLKTLSVLCLFISEMTLSHLPGVLSTSLLSNLSASWKGTPLKGKQQRGRERASWIKPQTKHLQVLCIKASLFPIEWQTLLTWIVAYWDERWEHSELISKRSRLVSNFLTLFLWQLACNILFSFSCTHLDTHLQTYHSRSHTRTRLWGDKVHLQFLRTFAEMSACALKGSDSFLMLHMQSGGRGRETSLIGIRCNFGNCFGSWWLNIQKTQAEHLPRKDISSNQRSCLTQKHHLTFVHEDHWSRSAPSTSLWWNNTGA